MATRGHLINIIGAFAYFICCTAVTCPLDNSHRGFIWGAWITQLCMDFWDTFYKLKVSVRFSLSKFHLCIVTTDSVAEDFTGELQEEAIWRSSDTEHVVCPGQQCRDVLRKLTLCSFSLTFTYRVSHPIVHEISSCFVLGVPLPCLGSSWLQ